MIKLHRLAISVVASLVPCLTLLVAAEIADDGPAFVRAPAAGLLYLGFVALPCLLPLAAARAALTRLAVLVVLTSVAAWAGWQMATIDDGQAGLAVLFVPFVAIPLGVVLWTVEVIVAHRRGRAGDADGGLTTAGVPERLAALVVDVAIAGAVLVAPLTMLSHAGMEVVAGLIGVVAGTLYLSGLLGRQGRTVGQSVLGLTVVDRATMTPLAPGRALLRGLVLVVELVAAPTFLVVVPVAELLSVHATGRSLTDRVVGTAVVAGVN